MTEAAWIPVCTLKDLVAGSGVAALIDGEQVAIFYLPDEETTLYAIDHHDPIGNAHVLARGIIGDIDGELVVASPLYKQHFSLSTGRCLEQDASVRVWPIRCEGDSVLIKRPEQASNTEASLRAAS